MRNTSILLILLLLQVSYGQAPATEWEFTYGGSLYESLGSVVPTTDGGFIAVGTTTSNDGDVTGNHGNGDIWVVKLNTSGQIAWQKTLGGTQGEFGRDIIQTSDGGYLVAGMSSSNDGDVSGGHGSADCWMVKLNSSGTIEWQKTFGGSGFDEIYSIKQTTEGGYIFLGWTYSDDGDVSVNHTGDADLWVAKVSSVGALVWERTYGGTFMEIPSEISQTSDSGFIIAAATRSADGDITNFHGDPGGNTFDIWILKLNPSGGIDWQKCFGGTGSEVICSIQQTSDGGYIFAAEPDSSDGDISEAPQLTDLWTVKISSTGAIEWQAMNGGSGFELLPIIRAIPGSGYIVLSQTESDNGDVVGNHGQCDIWLTKLNESGTLEWQKTFGGAFCDYPQALEITSDGGYVLGGDLSLTDLWDGNRDFMIAKLAPESLSVATNKPVNFIIYPNPAQNELTVKSNVVKSFDAVICRDTTGKCVAVSANSDTLNIKDLSAGIYTIEVHFENKVMATKFIKN